MNERKPNQPELVTAVAVRDGAQVQQAGDSSPYQIIMRAVADPACDPAKLRELLAVKQAWEQDEARKEFFASMAGFASECPIIAPLDPGDKSKYAKLDRIYREIRPLKGKYRLCVTWTEATVSEDGKMIHLRGFLSHAAGYSLPVKFDMPTPNAIISNTTGKEVGNVSQRMGSAMTYARRYGECAILNVVCGKDDDGAGGTGGEPINAGQIARLRELVTEARRTESELADVYGKQRLEEIPAAMFEPALRRAENAAKRAKAGAK